MWLLLLFQTSQNTFFLMVQTHKCLIPNLFPHTKAYSHTLADDLEEIINYPPKVNPQFVLYFIPLCFRVLCQMGQRATSTTVEWTRFKPRSWSDLNIFLVRVSFFFIIIIFKALGFTVETKHLNLVRCARVNKIKKLEISRDHYLLAVNHSFSRNCEYFSSVEAAAFDRADDLHESCRSNGFGGDLDLRDVTRLLLHGHHLSALCAGNASVAWRSYYKKDTQFAGISEDGAHDYSFVVDQSVYFSSTFMALCAGAGSYSRAEGWRYGFIRFSAWRGH